MLSLQQVCLEHGVLDEPDAGKTQPWLPMNMDMSQAEPRLKCVASLPFIFSYKTEKKKYNMHND